MARRSSENSVRVHVWLFESDVKRIAALYPNHERSLIIRQMVRQALVQTEAMANQNANPLNLEEIDPLEGEGEDAPEAPSEELPGATA